MKPIHTSQIRPGSPMSLLVWCLLIGSFYLCMPLTAIALEHPQLKPQTGPETLTLPAAINLALQNNAGLRSMDSMQQAKASRPSQVGALPDPELSFTAASLPTDTFDRTQEPMTQYKVGISQGIPFWGKRGLSEDAARFEAQSAEQDVEEFRFNLKEQVSRSWWELFYLDRSLEVVLKNQTLLRQFVEVAKTKYRVGQGLQQDALLAEVELSKLLDGEIQLKRLKEQETARLNALLNRDPKTKLQIPLDRNPMLPTLRPESGLYLLAEQHRPMLESQREQIKAANSRLELAQKDYYPNLMFGVEYGKRFGKNANGSDRADLASVKLGISIPIFAGSKQNEAVKQREYEALMNQSKLESLEIQVRSQVSSMVSDYDSTVEQALLFSQGIIPQAKQAVDSMQSAYRVNKVDFLNLVRMQMTLLNYETQYWRVFTHANQTLSKLEALVGNEEIYVQNDTSPRTKETNER